MNYMFYNALNFDQDLSTLKITGITSTNNINNMLYNTALTTYNYNQLLSGWSAQNVMKSVNLGIVGLNANKTKYGGCTINGLAGIAGYHSLVNSKNWIITDGGLDSCTITGSITYNPAGPLPSFGSTFATLTLNQT
ncbi:MAG: DUF285 domain-containing protein [Candidatus Peribacteria bacterium]|jgi:hypothetical protein|nr:DUF285 domain-containing protein [Candidatus Peribacteria bacterium]